MQVLPRHINNGACPRCLIIIQRYPGFHPQVLQWFKDFQFKRPEAHCSCAGRGELEQEHAFITGASKAQWRESAHNFNAALDLFELQGEIKNIYEPAWFEKILAPAVPQWLNWYGRKEAPFKELPHVELRDWRVLAAQGFLTLVEPDIKIANA